MGTLEQFSKQCLLFIVFFSPSSHFFFLQFLYTMSLLMKNRFTHLQVNTSFFLRVLCPSPFLLFFLFFCLSGMLAQPSSVGGRAHIPPSRSSGGKRGGGCLDLRAHTHTPRTLRRESPHEPAAVPLEEFVTMRCFVRPYMLPEATFLKGSVPLLCPSR